MDKSKNEYILIKDISRKVVITNKKVALKRIENIIRQFTYPNHLFNKLHIQRWSDIKDIYIVIHPLNNLLIDIIQYSYLFSVKVIAVPFPDIDDILITDSAFFEDDRFCIKCSEINQYFIITYKGIDYKGV